MEPKQNYLAVGAFVLAGMIGIVLFLIWISDASKSGDQEVYQTFVDESVNGLGVGSAVKYRGVDVGKVTIIDIPRRSPNKVRIVMRVNEDTPITVGTVAILQMQGITGLVYIELKGSVVDGQKILPTGNNKIPIIPSAPSQFKQIVDTVPDMLEKFTELAERLGDFASADNRRRFDQILINMETFSNQVGAANENGETLGSELNKTVVEVQAAAQSIKEITQASRGDMQRILKNLNVTVDKVNKLTDTTEDISKQGYQNLHDLLLELKKTARDLQALSREVKENPSKIIIPDQPGGVSIPKG
jgi:phospholipid/cholesterol/gamma-HCH transport system substrate-binding protein